MLQYSKDGTTVSVMLDTRRIKSDGKCPVKIRVTYKRSRWYYPTGKDLTPEEWEAMPTTKARGLASTRKDIESSYQIVRSAVEELATSGGFSLDALNNRLKGAATDTINTAFRAKMDLLDRAGRIGSMVVYRGVLLGLERFAGPHIRFEAVTPSWLGRYSAFLLSEGKTQTTVAIHLRHLRAILNEARQQGIIRDAQYPFGRGRYEIQEGAGRKMALSLDQIGQIARYDDGSEATAKYRDYWLFLYLCNGINVADFVRLRFRDMVNGEICFVRQKTEHTTRARKEIRVSVVEQMRAIIDRWGNVPAPDRFIFPVLDGSEDAMRRKMKTQFLTRAINKRMHAIGEALGIGNISTYTARHSFATVLKRAGANIAYISESLGHQDLRTTENYLASFEREERIKNAELLTKFNHRVMGRHKYDKFPSDMLSEGTIEAIKKELIASGKIDKNLYDWGVFNISIKRANMAQRHRFVESLKKLREYCDTNDVYWTSIPGVARITGRNVKTIRDWINKGFIPVARIGYISPSTYIVLKEAIESLSGLIYNSKLKKKLNH
ncbi:phage integrase SAM-like domain-containing protein [uncultured Alistipes sp.]|uniref:phage integrase SAM-like domain-containing protein n=1 Tax=uncultured Alistipes sp. TaxID=538949 RepID=UPI0034A04589